MNTRYLMLPAAMMLANTAQAGFLDDLSNVAKVAGVVSEVSKAVSDSDQSNSDESTSAQANDTQANAVNLSKKSTCTNDRIWSVFAGYDREYSGVDNGKRYSQRGFIDYIDGTGTSRCDLPHVQSPRCLYFVTKKQAYLNAGGKKLTMQCYYIDDPSTMITDKSLYPHNVNYFKPEQIITRCGNNKGVKGCVSGGAKKRAKHHLDNLRKHKNKDFSMCLPHGPSRRDVFCEYVNPETNRSLFKLSFTQTPN